MKLTTKRIWIWVILIPMFAFLGQSMCVWSGPRSLGSVAEILLMLSLFTGIFVLVAIPAAVYLIVNGVALRKDRERSIERLSKSVACVIFVGLWFLAVFSARSLRHQAFVRASYIGDQVVHALAQYRDDNGEYPDHLDQLLPKYLKEIPYTGMIAYPQFRYAKDFNNNQSKPGEYELSIFCPFAFGNFDLFIYWPTEKYPDHLGGDFIERIRAWAYVHE